MPLRSSKNTNKQRLFWASFRIFIALTSLAFFTYFLVQQVIDFSGMERLVTTVEVSVDLIDWLTAFGEETELTVSLMRNQSETVSKDTFSYDYLGKIQIQSEDSFNKLISNMESAEMMADSETDIITNYYSQYLSFHDYVFTHQYQSDWYIYFNFTNLTHNMRLFLMNINARNIDYQNEAIARYCVTLSAILYYRENLGMLRDALLELNNYTNLKRLEERDSVVEYHKGTKIYFREISQRIPGDLQSSFYNTIYDPNWQYCNDTVNNVITYTIDANFSTNISEWFYCTAYLMRSLRTTRTAIRNLLICVIADYRSSLISSLSLAIVGITLEAIAASTLIYQAVPVILLYFKFTKVVNSSSLNRPTSVSSGKDSLQLHPQS